MKASSKIYSLQTKTYKALKTKTIILLNQIEENTSVKSKVFIEFTLVKILTVENLPKIFYQNYIYKLKDVYKFLYI